MDPNQQPNPEQPSPQPQPAPLPPQPEQPQPTQATFPQAPSNYQAPATPQPYDANYLDSIAPAPARAKFISGSFGKIFFGLIALFVIAVSLIVAFSNGKSPTADMQQVAVRLENFTKTAKTVQKNLKSNKLSGTNTEFSVWLVGNQTQAADLLSSAGIKKAKYDKKITASETALTTKLNDKFEDARLNAILDRVYANTMASETEKLINLLNSIAKKNKSGKIHDFAQNASKNLVAIQKAFEDYNDDGN